MAEKVKARTGAEAMADLEPDLPHEWIAIAAYYIWQSEGYPDGRDSEIWERAKGDLTRLRKEGNLPTQQPSEREILDEER